MAKAMTSGRNVVVTSQPEMAPNKKRGLEMYDDGVGVMGTFRQAPAIKATREVALLLLAAS